MFALFASDEDKVSLESSASLIRNADGSLCHRIIHPVSEMPYTYARKNEFEPPLERYFTLPSGSSLTYSVYLFVGTPKYLNYGTAALMEACSRVFPFDFSPELSSREGWELGISYFRFLPKDADGVPMFSGHISDKLFSKMHSGELSSEDIANALKDPKNTALSLFSTSYEIGWAMCELMRSYALFRKHGIEKKNYRDFAIKLADFATNSYSDSYGFPKAWRIDGTPLSTAGSIGGL